MWFASSQPFSTAHDSMAEMTERYDLGFNLSHFMTTQSHDLEFYVALEKSTAKTDWRLEAARARSGALWPRNAEEAALGSGVRQVAFAV